MAGDRKWRGVYLEREFILSRAFRELRTATAYVVLMIFMTKRVMTKCHTSKRGGWIVANNGEIQFTYGEAREKWGISDDRFSRALDELIEKGFIDVAEPGIGVHKLATLYSISERWKDYGTDRFVKRERHRGPINHGFKKGNRLGRNCRRAESTVI